MKKSLIIVGMLLLVLWFANSASAAGTTDRDSYGMFVQRSMLAYYYSGDTQQQCENDTPLYTCAGLMASGFEAGHDWYEPYVANHNEKTSFSYWTPRTRRNPVVNLPEYHSQGIVFWPPETLADDGTAMLPEYTCAYNNDAGTEGFLGNGCGQSKQKCQDLGITTMEQYQRQFGDDPIMTQCGNALEGETVDAVLAFETTLDEEAYLIEKERGFTYDEILMKAWPVDVPEKVPLMAFYCDRTTTYSDQGDTCSEARNQQSAYYQQTHVFAPVIRLLGDWAHVSFSYQSADQSTDIPDVVTVFGGLKNGIRGAFCLAGSTVIQGSEQKANPSHRVRCPPGQALSH